MLKLFLALLCVALSCYSDLTLVDQSSNQINSANPADFFGNISSSQITQALEDPSFDPNSDGAYYFSLGLAQYGNSNAVKSAVQNLNTSGTSNLLNTLQSDQDTFSGNGFNPIKNNFYSFLTKEQASNNSTLLPQSNAEALIEPSTSQPLPKSKTGPIKF